MVIIFYKRVTVAAVLAAVLNSAAMADAEMDNDPEQQPPLAKERMMGASSGFVVGALLGGPLGAFIGTVAGDHMGKHEQETRQLNGDLAAARAAIVRYQQQIAALQAEQYQLQTVNFTVKEQPAILAMLSGHSTTIQFRTGSSTLEYHYQPTLARLLALLQEHPGLIMHLEGYADSRGQSAYNRQLSLQRSQQVAEFMLRGGIDSHRLIVNSYGEDKRLHNPISAETHSFERRVVITLQHPGQQI